MPPVEDSIGPADRAAIGTALAGSGEHGRVERIERLGGLTNRNYKIVTGAGAIVVRLPGLGTEAYIDRDVELHNARVAAALGVGPAILDADNGILVSPFIEGRVLSPAIIRDEPDTRARVGRLLRVVHDSARSFASRFDPVTVIRDHRAGLEDVPGGVDDLIISAERLDRAADRRPSHNDPLPENFIDAGDRLYLLDWEYSGAGERAWDLADLAVEADLGVAERQHLISAYAGDAPPSDLSRRVLDLEPVTDLLWGLWALVQERDGNRADDFGAYGRRRLAQAARALC